MAIAPPRLARAVKADDKLPGYFLNAPFRWVAEAGVAAGVVVERVGSIGGDPSLHEIAWRFREAPLGPPVRHLRNGLPAAPDHVAGRFASIIVMNVLALAYGDGVVRNRLATVVA